MIKAGLFKNPYLVFSLVAGIVLEVSVISVPRLAQIFGVVPLDFVCWLTVAALSVMPLVIVEAQKAVTARILKKRG